jgi:hypothetical protein
MRDQGMSIDLRERDDAERALRRHEFDELLVRAYSRPLALPGAADETRGIGGLIHPK